MQVYEFLLEGCVERLGGGVVEADPSLSYRRNDPAVKAAITKFTASVLTATIRVHDDFALTGMDQAETADTYEKLTSQRVCVNIRR